MEDNESDFITDLEEDSEHQTSDMFDDVLQALIHLRPMFEFGEEA